MMETPPRPIPESYWVEPGRFLAGEYPGHHEASQAARRIRAFLDAGFDTFLDLTQAGELVPYEPTLREEAQRNPEHVITYRRFPIGDYGLPSSGQMKKILDTLDASLAARRKVYLHCWGGVGRTGTVVGCHLVRQGKTGEQALRQLAEWWQAVPKRVRFPRSPETDAQVQFILDWKG
jgi:hypothetical protein